MSKDEERGIGDYRYRIRVGKISHSCLQPLSMIYDEEGVLSVDGNTISVKSPSDAYCEDADGEELPQYADQSSCENAGNDWYEASCILSEYTKQ